MNTKLYASCLAILLGMGISGSGSAATITTKFDGSSAGALAGVDVGSLDTLLYQGASPAGGLGDSQLTTWINDYFSNPDPAITYSTRTEEFTGFKTSDPVLAAYQLQGPVDYFILHNAKDIALFQNVASLDWAVFDYTALLDDFNIKAPGTQISFIAEFNSGQQEDFCTLHPTDPSCLDIPTPEPSMTAIIGIGLLSFAASYAFRRKSLQV